MNKKIEVMQQTDVVGQASSPVLRILLVIAAHLVISNMCRYGLSDKSRLKQNCI